MERRRIVEAVENLWHWRPRLRANLSLTARRLVRELGLDPGRERTVRRLAALVQRGQTAPETDRDLKREVVG